MATLYMGLSGFAYPEWKGEGRFYPADMKHVDYFRYYVSRYNALEADNTWYKMPAKTAVAKWIAESPESFKFSPKMHRKVSHIGRLKPECFDACRFFVDRLKPLEEAGKLGPILIQMPANLKRDDERLKAFLNELPKRTTLRWSMEFRSESWRHQEVFDLLKENNVSWVDMDTDEKDAKPIDLASHFFVRLRKTDYRDEQLKSWAVTLKERLDRGVDCFVYCKHQDTEAPWLWADRITQLVEAGT